MRIRRFLAERAGEAFGPSFFAFLAFALVSGTLSYRLAGEAAFFDSLRSDTDLLLSILPRIGAALLVAGFIRVLLSREFVARWVGGQSGLRGILIGELAGLCTPGGPVTAFSLIAALRVAGADRGVLVAYATGWALLGLQRILVWEVPFLGADFALTRIAASVLLPIFAALLARRMPPGLEPHRPAGG
ncbi:MAG: hypothetical protein ACE5KF_02090 [Kiloniellaceae bacterium]